MGCPSSKPDWFPDNVDADNPSSWDPETIKTVCKNNRQAEEIKKRADAEGQKAIQDLQDKQAREAKAAEASRKQKEEAAVKLAEENARAVSKAALEELRRQQAAEQVRIQEQHDRDRIALEEKQEEELKQAKAEMEQKRKDEETEKEKSNPFHPVKGAVPPAPHILGRYEKEANVSIVGSRGMGKSSIINELKRKHDAFAKTGVVECSTKPVAYGFRSPSSMMLANVNLWDVQGYSKRFGMCSYVQHTGIRYNDLVILLVFDIKEFDYQLMNAMDSAEVNGKPMPVPYIVVRSKLDQDISNQGPAAYRLVKDKLSADLRKYGVAQKSNFKGLFIVSSKTPWAYDMKDMMKTIFNSIAEGRKMDVNGAMKSRFVSSITSLYPHIFSEKKTDLEDLEDDLDALAKKLKRGRISKDEYEQKRRKALDSLKL